jgi:hypothetical protein
MPTICTMRCASIMIPFRKACEPFLTANMPDVWATVRRQPRHLQRRFAVAYRSRGLAQPLLTNVLCSPDRWTKLRACAAKLVRKVQPCFQLATDTNQPRTSSMRYRNPKLYTSKCFRKYQNKYNKKPMTFFVQLSCSCTY